MENGEEVRCRRPLPTLQIMVMMMMAGTLHKAVELRIVSLKAIGYAFANT
jgi:hypothetical protein